MGAVEKLTDILKRLNAGEDPEAVQAEAREFLAAVSPADLSLAEQSLMEAGLSVADLQRLCSLHLDVLGRQEAHLKEKVAPGHVLHTLVSEHEMILTFLDHLEEVNRRVQAADAYDPRREEYAALRHIAEHLVEAEAHHQREEDVLFPELERRGLFGPPEVMRAEHVELRAHKQELKRLAEAAGELDFSDFRRRLDAEVGFIVPTLRDHIAKEDNILYAAALEVIPDNETWARLKQECDRIGYCCFTPES